MKKQRTSDKDLDIGVLHEAINDFNSTLSKVRSRKRLENYHKHYMKQVISKTRSIEANQLSKVHQLIPPGIGTDHNFNIYTFLRDLSTKLKIEVPVIESLYMRHTGEISVIYNNELGVIKSQFGELSLTTFLSKFENTEKHQTPLFIIKTKSGKKEFFYSVEDIQKNLETLRSQDCLVQRFIDSSEENCFIFRVHYKEPARLRGYIIGKKKVSKTGKKIIKSHCESKQTFEDDVYLEKAKEIIRQIRSKKERQFSLFSTESVHYHKKNEEDYSVEQPDINEISSEYPHSLKEKLERKFSLPWNEENDEKKIMVSESSNNMIVTGRNPDSSYFTEVKAINDEIKKLTLVLVKVLRIGKIKVKEITLDFIKDQNKWLLLKCDKVLINENEEIFKEITMPLSSSSFIEYSKKSKSSMIEISSKKTEEKLSEEEMNLINNMKTIQYVRKPSIRLRTSLKPTEKKLFQEKYDETIKRLENLSNLKNRLVSDESSNLIKFYEKCFLNFNQAVKEKSACSESFKILPVEQEDLNAKSGILKSALCEYDQMMIHVRRLNLEKKSPILNLYGGDDFWHEVLKKLYKKLVQNPVVQPYFSHITTEGFKKISRGLQCLFNSNITIEFRRKIRSAHKGLGIKNKDFQTFRTIFLQILKDGNVSKEHLEVIQDNFNSFHSAVVSIS